MKFSWNILGIKLLFIAIASLVCAPSFAQQDPVYSQYMNNLLSVNPSYAGIRGVGSLSVMHRKQWIGLDGPETSSLTYSMPLDTLLNVGGGIDFIYDEIGPIKNAALFLNYSYKIKATDNTWLNFGLKGGFNFMQARLTSLYRYHYDDSYILEYGDIDRWMPNFGVGALWYNNSFYVGFAIPRLLQNKYVKEEQLVDYSAREHRHVFLHGSYTFDLSEQIKFKPGLTTIMVSGAPITADFDFSFLFNDRFWLGAMYRMSDAVGAYAQVQVGSLKFGVAYDYSHTRLRQYSNGTFEVMLRVDLKTWNKQIFPSTAF